mgnify:CR=1 FL=1
MYAYAPDELAQIAKGKWESGQVQCSALDEVASGARTSESASEARRSSSSGVGAPADASLSNVPSTLPGDKNCIPLKSIAQFCFDARQIKAGDCFIALSGGARDGHDFIEINGKPRHVISYLNDFLFSSAV